MRRIRRRVKALDDYVKCEQYTRDIYANDVHLGEDMVIIETSVFTRIIKELMSDDEYLELQKSLITRPDAGDLIRHSGGLRKLRWKLEGRGKSGGVRVIYYWVTADDQIRMVYAFPKNKQENLTPAQLDALRKIVERWSDE